MDRKGFTLIELLVVLSIIAVLSSIVLVSLQRARQSGSVAAGLQFEDHLYHGAGDQAVIRYDFERGTTGLTALDASFGNNNGNITGSPAPIPSAIYLKNTPSGSGYSLYCNGSMSVTTQKNVVLPGGSLPAVSETVAVWVKTSVTSNQGILQFGSNNRRLFSGYVTGKTVWFFGQGGFFSPSYNVIPSVADGRWHHLAYTLKGNQVTEYLDGKIAVAFTLNPGPSQVTVMPAENNPLTVCTALIGTPTGPQYYPFTGNVDNVTVYNRAITASEMQRLYAEGLKTHTLADAAR